MRGFLRFVAIHFILGLAFVALVLFLSVYTGYHYALDGYVSITMIGGLWVALRLAAARRTSAAGAPGGEGRGGVLAPAE